MKTLLKIFTPKVSFTMGLMFLSFMGLAWYLNPHLFVMTKPADYVVWFFPAVGLFLAVVGAVGLIKNNQ